MNIWVKATVTDGGKSQRLTLKVEGKGEEAELEIVFGETQIQPAGEAKPPQVAVLEGEKPAVVEGAQAEGEEVPLTSEELTVAFDEEPVEQEEPSITGESAPNSTSLVEEVTSILEDNARDYASVEPAEERNEKLPEPEEPAAANITSDEKEHEENKEEIILEVPATASDTKKAKFMELLYRSANFEDLILKTAEWFELGKKTSYFVQVIKAATQAKKVNWSSIEAILKANGVQWRSYDKLWTSKQVTNKFKEINIDATFMDLIKEFVENKDFDFSAWKQYNDEAQPVTEEVHDKEHQTSEVAEPDVSADDGQVLAENQATAVEVRAETAQKGKLEEIAEKSNDFEDFLKNITTWLELGNRTSYFVAVAKAATQVEKVNWSSIEAVLEQNGIHWGASDKIWTSKQVTNKFLEIKRDVSIMKMIKEIVGYQDFSFIAHGSATTGYNEDSATFEEEETIPTEEIHQENIPVVEESITQEEQTLEENQPLTEVESVLEPAEPVNGVSNDDKQVDVSKTARVRMSCMPEIPEFEETLANIDKAQPLSTRVVHVLNAMGLQNQQFMDSQLIIQIAEAAVKSEELLDLDVLATDSDKKAEQNRWLASILAKANIPQTLATIARMKMTAFINEFTERHCPNAKTVKLLHFLKDLQKVVSDV